MTKLFWLLLSVPETDSFGPALEMRFLGSWYASPMKHSNSQLFLVSTLFFIWKTTSCPWKCKPAVISSWYFISSLNIWQSYFIYSKIWRIMNSSHGPSHLVVVMVWPTSFHYCKTSGYERCLILHQPEDEHSLYFMERWERPFIYGVKEDLVKR